MKRTTLKRVKGFLVAGLFLASLAVGSYAQAWDADLVIGHSNFTSAGFNNLDNTDMYYPYSNSVIVAGKYIVADTSNHRVLIYNTIPTSSGAQADVVVGQPNFNTNTSGLSATKLNNPRGVHSDGTKLFIADYSNNRVLIYNSIPTTNGAAASVVVGQTSFTVGTLGTSQTKLYNPSGVFSDGTKLYIADSNNHRALIYNTIPIANGAAASVVVGQTDFITRTTGLSQTKYNFPYTVTVSGTKMFVADYTNNRVLIYNTIPTANGAAASVVAGQPDFITGTAGTTQSKFYNPTNAYSDGTKFYVADYTNHRALIYNSVPTTNGALANVVIGQTSFTVRTSGTSQTKLYYPSGISSDGTKLFIADRYNHRALIYNTIPIANGAAADVAVGHSTFTNGTANDVDGAGIYYTGRTCIAAGKLFVVDPNNNRVLIYNTVPTSSGAAADLVIGQTTLNTNTAGTSQTTLRTPNAVFSDGTKVYIADTGNNRVLIYNSIPTANGAAASVVVGQAGFTTSTAATSQTGLRTPRDVYANGKLFIGDSANHRIIIHNSVPTSNGAAASVVVGQPDFITGTSGLTQNKMNTPYGVQSNGTKLFVADTNNHRVLIYNTIPTANNAPADVVVGQTNFTTGTLGTSSTKLYNPNRIFIPNGKNKIYIADSNNHRVIIYDSIPATNGAAANKVVGQNTFTTRTTGTSTSKFNYPNFAFVDSGRLYVSDYNNNRVVSGLVPNGPPVLDLIGNKTGNEGQLLQFTISATDPDNDTLTYSASNLPSGATFNPSTRIFSWTPGYTQAGTYPNVHFEVSDGLATDLEDITITINSVTASINIQNGYFYDRNIEEYWLAHGIAYQTWNRPLGMWQTTAQIDYDLDEMVKANVNSIRVDFVWKQIEEAGDNLFDWTNYDYLVNACAQRGIKIFALVGYQWPPDWFPKSTVDDPTAGWYTMHPPGNDNEGIYQPNRWRSDIMSFEDANTRAQYTEFLSAVATRYKDNATIAGWIVGNEYGYLGLWSGKQDGFDKDSETAFRNWLATYYNNDINALNTAWGIAGTSYAYASFNNVIMPEQYTRDDVIEKPGVYKYDPSAWWDLVQWREDSAASLVAIGAQAVRNADPNHLISYATVGMQWGEEDWRYHAEDTGKIIKACKDLGTPLDFWSINNYPWRLTGHESQTGQWGVVYAKWKTGLPVLCTETGFTSSETMYPGINEQNQGPLISNSLWEELEAGAIGVHIFTWNDRPYITDREKGFGIVYADRRTKPAFWVVRDAYDLMEQLDVRNLIANSTDPTPDVAFYWSDATDGMYNRYECNMQQIFGPLERLGLEPTFLNRTELLTSKYFKDIWQSDAVLNLSTVHGGARSLKISAGSGGGTVAVYPANSTQVVDLSAATTFSVWVYDTQGNNTIQLRLRDSDGDGGSGGDGYYLWSSNASVQNVWTKINWDLTTYPSVPNLDKNKIASVESYEFNQGVYYFDDTTYVVGTETAFQNFEKNNGTPRDYSSYAAIILPRNKRVYAGDLNYIRTKVIPAGVHIYADADLPGMQDYHAESLSDFVTEVDSMFGINATDTSGYDDPVENEQYGINWVTITTNVTQALSPLTLGRQDTFRAWKYSNMTLPTTGTVYATHSNGNPALVIKDNGTSKAAITTFSLGDRNPDGDSDGQPDIIPWAQRYDWFKAIFLNGLGIQPTLNVTGSQYVLVDYRTAADGSILISAKNYREDQNETVTITTSLIQGKAVENLTSGGVIETNSDGTFNLTLGSNGHALIRAYAAAPSKKVYILDAPATVHPMGDKSYLVKVRYDTLAALNLTLYLAFQEDGDNGDGTPNEIYNSTNITVSGAGEQSLWLWIPDPNMADTDYKSTPDGGNYRVYAWLEENSVKVSEAYQKTQLEWGDNPTTPLPTALNKGQIYTVNFEWENLPEYQSWENTPLNRETAYVQRVAVVRSAKTQALYPTHYDKANQVCDWLESLGYVHSNLAVTHFDDVVVSGGAVFSDDFNDGNADGWTRTEGSSRWSVNNFEYRIDRMSQSPNIQVAGNSTWTDYTVETKFKYVTKDPYFKETYLIFRYQDTDNYYYVKTYDNYGLWRVKYGGRVAGVDFVGNVANIDVLAENVFHTLKVVATGSTFQVYLNGQNIGQFTDNRLANGKIGLGAKASQLGVWEPLKGYYFADDNERDVNGNLLNLDWGYLKEFFPVVILPSVYVMNNNECYNIKAYLQAGQFTVLATDGGVAIKKPDGSSGTGRIESAFGVDTGYTTLSNLQNLEVTDNTHYVTKDYANGQNIATDPNASAIAWTLVTTGSKVADIKNATSSAPALISNLQTKGNVSFQDFEPDNGTSGAYFYDAWQSNPAFETTIVHGGTRSVKMTSGVGGGTIGINLAALVGYVDLRTMTTFHAWVYDTQGSNSLQIKFKDKWGAISSATWSSMAATQNQWSLISWTISPTQAGIDWSRIASIELYEWNQGVYYFDDTYFVTSDFGEKKGKAFVFNYGVDTYNQMTNQFSMISQRTFEWGTREIYKMKVQLKYATPNPLDGDLLLAEKEFWTIDPSGSTSLQFTVPTTTLTGDGKIYWVIYAYPWDSADPWVDHTGSYTAWNDPGYESSISGYGLFHAGATFLSTGGRTFDNWIAYNTRGDTLKLNFGFKEATNNGDALTNEIYGGSPMFDGKIDPNSWLTETVYAWASNANASGARPELFMTFKDIASATTPTLTFNFNLTGTSNQLTVDKSTDRLLWTNIYTSPTAEGAYNPTISLDTTAKYYRVTLNDGDTTFESITLQKKMSLTGYPSASAFRLEDWLQTKSVTGLLDDFRDPYVPEYALVPDYDPADTDLKNYSNGGKYNWVTWFTETSDIYEIPTDLYWAPRLKVESPTFPTTFDPGTQVNVPVMWEGLDTIVTITAWKPYAVTFPLTLRIFLQDVYTGVTYVTSDFIINTGSGDQSFAINVPANTPYGSNYMWGAYFFDHKRVGVQPYEERIGMDDTFRFTATGQPYEPETTITVGTAYTVYSDAGIPTDSSLFTWGPGSWNGDYTGETPPEGVKCFQTISYLWAGWGVFHTSGVKDLSSYSSGYLKFWVKSNVSLKVEIEGPQYTSSYQYIASTGGVWQEFALPISSFPGINLTQVYCPFRITSDYPTTFYVDFVRWTH